MSLLIMIDKPSLGTLGILNWHHCTYLTDPSNKIFEECCLLLVVAMLFLLNGLILCSHFYLYEHQFLH